MWQNLLEALRKNREYLLFLSTFDIKNETHPGGLKLACGDAIGEEILIMEEMKIAYDDVVKNLHAAAYKRAELRNTQDYLVLQATEGFNCGLHTALGNIGEAKIAEYLALVKSETNFGFAFICALMCVVEAIKGKSYKASWQADGENGSILPNIKRKYDRIKAMAGTLPGLPTDEARPTTSLDLSVYATKTTVWYNEFDPEGFKQLIAEVRALTIKQGV